MLRAMSTFYFVKERLHPGLLDAMVRGGAQAIEIFCARGHFDYGNKSHIKEIAGWFKQNPIPLNSIHSPLFGDYDWGRDGSPPLNVVDTDKKRRIDAMDEIKRALELAEQVPFKYIVQHMGNPGEYYDERKFEAGLTSVEHLRAFAKPLGVSVLVENIPNDMSTPEKLLDFIRIGHFGDVGVCLDVGHAHMVDGVLQSYEKLKDHVRSTHIHDNNKDRDAHFWPGKGSIDWNETMALLASAPHTPPLLMEIEGEEGGDVVKGMSEAFRFMEQATKAAAHNPL